MRPVISKTVVIPPPYGDDGDPHYHPDAAPAPASERLYTLSPREIELLAAGGAVRIRQEGFRLEFDIAAADEIDG